MPGPERRAAAVPGAADLVTDYQAWLAVEGRGSVCYRNAAWAFLGRWPDPGVFEAAPLDAQMSVIASQRPFLTYLMLTGRVRPGYDYLAHRKIGGLLAQAGRSRVAADLAAFTAAATDLDYSGHIIKRAAERVVVRMLIQTGRPRTGRSRTGGLVVLDGLGEATRSTRSSGPSGDGRASRPGRWSSPATFRGPRTRCPATCPRTPTGGCSPSCTGCPRPGPPRWPGCTPTPCCLPGPPAAASASCATCNWTACTRSTGTAPG